MYDATQRQDDGGAGPACLWRGAGRVARAVRHRRRVVRCRALEAHVPRHVARDAARAHRKLRRRCARRHRRLRRRHVRGGVRAWRAHVARVCGAAIEARRHGARQLRMARRGGRGARPRRPRRRAAARQRRLEHHAAAKFARVCACSHRMCEQIVQADLRACRRRCAARAAARAGVFSGGALVGGGVADDVAAARHRRALRHTHGVARRVARACLR